MIESINEETVESAALDWLQELQYQFLHGPDIAPGELYAERTEYSEVILKDRLRKSLARINPGLPLEALDDAFRKVLRLEQVSLIENNHAFHKELVSGVEVEYQRDGRTVGDIAWLIDFTDDKNNDWLVVNQFTVVENRHNRRADIVIFINGLPLCLIEFKNLADTNTTTRKAFDQLQTYKAEIPSLLAYNEVLVASDGIIAKAGTLTSEWQRFMPWRTIDGEDLAPTNSPQLEVLLKGIFEKKRFLDLIRYFINFESTKEGTSKKIAGYHQFHAVQKAVESTLVAVRGDKRAGIIWHTQGSGKSLTMLFYAGKIIQLSEMQNPTVVMITDRNDLDDQLFGTFSLGHEVLRQNPVQAETRVQLRELLTTSSGGVVFTTIQKFLPEEKGDTHPLLSDRRNIVVIADEAHRTQYDFIDGFARHIRDALPNASFIGFTATPVELTDRNTTAVFGDVIDVYDVYQSIEDQATVPIYYEARMARLDLMDEEKPRIDPNFEEITEGEEETVKKRLKSKWARLEALVGSPKRIELIARDIVEHFENRQGVLQGKGLIVGMSRRICVNLYAEIIKLRPQWDSTEDKTGFLKVVMTGSASDPVDWQKHVRSKRRREDLADRFKDSKDELTLVIVRDMWLTGFDVPSLHTMYVDKPMRSHNLMQAIARVNRVFKDKPGGLVVDYLGIGHELKKALAQYSEKDRGKAAIPQEQAVSVMLEKYEVIKNLFHGYDYSSYYKMTTAKERVQAIVSAMQFVLDPAKLENGKSRFLEAVGKLSKSFALAVPHEAAIQIRDEVGFFQTIRAAILKNTTTTEKEQREELDSAIQQIVSRAIATDEVIDIFGDSKMKRPDLSILSEDFLEELKGMPQKNVALELLNKLMKDEIKIRSRINLVQSRMFSDMLEDSIIQYHNRTLEAAEIIERLIELAKEMKKAYQRGDELNLSDEELAFYDALETNDSAVKVLGDETLRTIARELVETVRNNLSIDWTQKESVRAKLRVIVKRILRKYGYPPDKQEKATVTVLQQAELLSENWGFN